MQFDKDEVKAHMANKPKWHHAKGKAIEVGLYVRYGSVKLNNPAPRDLSIWDLEGNEVVLDSVFQKYQSEGQMVILNIGSFTCPVWRERQHRVHELSQLYSQHVVCVTIYVREAHASDEWALDINDKANISYPKPTSLEERTIVAKRAIAELMYSDAVVYIDCVDNNAVNRAYRAVPIRICAIDSQGDLVFRSQGHGPFGYKPEELGSFLEEKFGKVEGALEVLGES